MNAGEQNGPTDAGVLRWPGKLLSTEDLRRHLAGLREVIVVPGAIVTPLVLDELKARKVRLVRGDAGPKVSARDNGAEVGYAQERAHPLVEAVIASLRRDGVSLADVRGPGGASVRADAPPAPRSQAGWARASAQAVANGVCQRLLLLCGDPGLVCCVANKVAGIRAVAASTAQEAARAARSLNANVFAVDMAGRTFFEARQILLNVCKATTASCPADVAETLRELDGHAHR